MSFHGLHPEKYKSLNFLRILKMISTRSKLNKVFLSDAQFALLFINRKFSWKWEEKWVSEFSLELKFRDETLVDSHFSDFAKPGLLYPCIWRPLLDIIDWGDRSLSHAVKMPRIHRRTQQRQESKTNDLQLGKSQNLLPWKIPDDRSCWTSYESQSSRKIWRKRRRGG